MRVWSLIAATILSLGTFSSQVMAQAEGAAGATAGAAAPKVIVAVVDIGHILKNHPTMKGQMEAIQASMTAADEEMGQRRDAILKEMNQLREQYTEGSPEYEAAEKKIAEKDTEFRLSLIKKKKEFDEAQAQVIYNVYTQINGLLKMASDHYGTQLVIRVSREKMDPKKPETIQMVMGQDVLYYSPNVDWTEWVLGQLAQTASRPAAAAQR
ncbi:OmpH family outer membrane protein [Aureliella helgolandensis]|uniref:Outer membrane protein (OmpH-like) n=1 Tax=Aureliella helgolandensis TaxID=2527968 RepID=A0A518G1B6_9BACT|nr:OmpH family outer membrane protein [Aureliella helgolandensis]QDV22383.1 Outer membrane protein (OmpH-like) [Aureliella helgolandensis]